MQQRMTKQKKLVLDVVQKHCDHPSADQIYLEVRAIDGRISRGTVYRNLCQLSDSGALLHVKVPGPDRFDGRLDYHYHMVCTDCGAVCDIPLEYQRDMDGEVMASTGYLVKRHRTVFEGLCPKCIEKQKAGSLGE